jgi:hypothetical protein
MELAALEEGCGTSEDEVDIALDVAAAPILPRRYPRCVLLGATEAAGLHLGRRKRPQEDGVLMSQKAAGIHDEAVAVCIERKRLADLTSIPCRVLDRQVLEAAVRSID